MRVQQRLNVGRASRASTSPDGDQHQQRTDERVEKELEARIDAPLAAPNADDEKHRDQAAFEEQIEQHQIQRAEHADHQRLQHEEGDHIFRRRAWLIDRQEARIEKGIRNVVSSTKGIEKPSTP